MYPAAPSGAGRVVHEDFVVSYTDTLTGEQKSVEFRKNDMISPFVMGAGRSPENYLRAEVWDPQRWCVESFLMSSHADEVVLNVTTLFRDRIDDATGNGGALSPYAYAPFGNGARKCLGERLALAQLRIVLASTLDKYDLLFCKDQKFVVASQGTIKAGNGVFVKLAKV
ncbi:Cytochrome P450 4B1 [Gonapodya sp. JEL0774]|nr:Cytochrome P450 4B1 [Gonapodya sp. JEL0774]